MEGQKELFNIKKNVIIRNSIQHHNRVIDLYGLNQLGLNAIEVLDDEGNIVSVKEGENFPY